MVNDKPSSESLKILHKTIKKINDDIENFSFNTSVSAFMICVNGLSSIKCNNRSILESLCVLLSPFAPHISEEIWNKLGHNESISFVNYPECNPVYIKENNVEYPVSFNGKLKFKLVQESSLDIHQIKQNIIIDQRTNNYLDGRGIKKIIVVPGKIINIVC